MCVMFVYTCIMQRQLKVRCTCCRTCKLRVRLSSGGVMVRCCEMRAAGSIACEVQEIGARHGAGCIFLHMCLARSPCVTKYELAYHLAPAHRHSITCLKSIEAWMLHTQVKHGNAYTKTATISHCTSSTKCTVKENPGLVRALSLKQCI
jgi:hypothetical protein